MQADEVKVVLVLASWSSGSTSVAGFLDKCGGYTCPPHVETVDERTPVAYEPLEYMQVLTRCVDENTLKPTASANAFPIFFRNWIAVQKKKAAEQQSRFVVLKHPLQSFVLPAILSTEPDCRIVLVTRPFAKIEETRARRGWGGSYGEAGARIVYGASYTHLHDASLPYLVVPYEKFRGDKSLRGDMLAYIGLAPTPERLAEAEAWLK